MTWWIGLARCLQENSVFRCPHHMFRVLRWMPMAVWWAVTLWAALSWKPCCLGCLSCGWASTIECFLLSLDVRTPVAVWSRPPAMWSVSICLTYIVAIIPLLLWCCVQVTKERRWWWRMWNSTSVSVSHALRAIEQFHSSLQMASLSSCPIASTPMLVHSDLLYIYHQ